jgi:hypothetical protein
MRRAWRHLNLQILISSQFGREWIKDSRVRTVKAKFRVRISKNKINFAKVGEQNYSTPCPVYEPEGLTAKLIDGQFYG